MNISDMVLWLKSPLFLPFFLPPSFSPGLLPIHYIITVHLFLIWQFSSSFKNRKLKIARLICSVLISTLLSPNGQTGHFPWLINPVECGNANGEGTCYWFVETANDCWETVPNPALLWLGRLTSYLRIIAHSSDSFNTGPARKGLTNLTEPQLLVIAYCRVVLCSTTSKMTIVLVG